MKKKDIIFSLCLLLAAGFVYIIIRIMGNTEGNQVVINVGGKEYGRYPLNENKDINVKNQNGYNTIVILNGKVHIEDADCPDKYCVKQGDISKKGETLICLPHKLSVEINSADKDSGIDAMAQ